MMPETDREPLIIADKVVPIFRQTLKMEFDLRSQKMSRQQLSKAMGLRQRVIDAAEVVLKQRGSVGPLEVLQQMGLLAPSHVQGWMRGNQYYSTLERHIQGGPKKLQDTYRFFQEWAESQNLQSSESDYCRATPTGAEPLQVTENNDPEREHFFRTHYLSPNLSAKKKQGVVEKLTKTPELVVFELVSPTSTCRDCGAEIWKGSFIYLDRGEPLCLSCADLDHLEFLPSGNTALTRRAKKYSPLSAVVVRFSRARKRYERQGILVRSEAIAKAESECLEDAELREARRARDVKRREAADCELVQQMTGVIQDLFPNCPAEESRMIAEHTAARGSGRVGRSAAGRSCDANAMELAITAWIRHQHTNYDELLMRGQTRDVARDLIRPDVQRILAQWSNERGSLGNR
jgi:hypothetical protein